MDEQLELFTDKPTKSFTTAELDAMAQKIVKLEKEYNAAKEVSNLAEAKYKEAREEMIKAFVDSGMTKYYSQNVGTLSLVNKYKVRVPDTIEKKEALFKWIENQLGKEAALNYTTINYMTLNSLYNQELERAAIEGRLDTFSMDGVDLPTSEQTLSVRRN